MPLFVVLLIWVCTLREPFKLNDFTLNVLLCKFNEGNWYIVSYALKSRAPIFFIISRFVALTESLPNSGSFITALKVSLSCCDLGSPFVAYFARYSTQA